MGTKEDIAFAAHLGASWVYPNREEQSCGITLREYLLGQAIAGAALEIAGGMVDAAAVSDAAILLVDSVLRDAGRTQPGPKFCAHCNCAYYTGVCHRCERSGVDLSQDSTLDGAIYQRPFGDGLVVPRPGPEITRRPKRGGEGEVTVGG